MVLYDVAEYRKRSGPSTRPRVPCVDHAANYCGVLSYTRHSLPLSCLSFFSFSRSQGKEKDKPSPAKAAGSRKSPAGPPSGRKQSAKAAGGRGAAAVEANSKMRAELDEATRKRNDFLSERYARCFAETARARHVRWNTCRMLVSRASACGILVG